jgi:phage-related protein
MVTKEEALGLVSWNFQHIVKVATRRVVSATSRLAGYREVEIRRPSTRSVQLSAKRWAGERRRDKDTTVNGTRGRPNLTGVPQHRRWWRDYRTPAGRRPVRDFIAHVSLEDRAKILAAMRRVAETGPRVARHLRGDIWEIRVEGQRQAFRILFASEGRFSHVLLSLDAFSKKTQKTPTGKIELAEQRLADWRSRGRTRRG